MAPTTRAQSMAKRNETPTNSIKSVTKRSVTSTTRPRTVAKGSVTPTTKPVSKPKRCVTPATGTRSVAKRSVTPTTTPNSGAKRSATPKTRPNSVAKRSATPKTRPNSVAKRSATPASRPNSEAKRSATPSSRSNSEAKRSATPASRPNPEAKRSASPKITPKRRVTVEQLRMLFEAMERDPIMYNVSKAPMLAYLYIQKWMDLAHQLNATDGAQLTTQDWKFLLRHWCNNIKNKMLLPKEKRYLKKINISAEEHKQLIALEEKFAAFMRNEETRDTVDVTSVGQLGSKQQSDSSTDTVETDDSSVKFVAQLLNRSSGKKDENSLPTGRGVTRTRKIVMKGKTPDDPGEVFKQIKTIFNSNNVGDPEEQILGHQLGRLHQVSRQLEEHISTVQSRIHMIKDLWKHECVDY